MIKYLSGVALLFLMITVVASLLAIEGVGEGLFPWKFEDKSSSLKKFVVPKIPEVPGHYMKDMARLMPQLQMLANPGHALPEGEQKKVDLAVFGYSPNDVAQVFLAKGEIQEVLSKAEKEEREKRIDNYTLTLSVLGTKTHYCLIDGNIYREGEKLPGGEVVQKITQSKALIVKGERKKWLEIIPEDYTLPELEEEPEPKRMTKAQAKRQRNIEQKRDTSPEDQEKSPVQSGNPLLDSALKDLLDREALIRRLEE